MRKLKYVKLFENFDKLNESVNENWVVKPYEFETPQDWEEEFEPDVVNKSKIGGKYWSIELNSTKRPPQNEVDEFKSYIDGRVEEKNAYGKTGHSPGLVLFREDTFVNIIESLLFRSFKEMFKVKKPARIGIGSSEYLRQDLFFTRFYDDNDWYKDDSEIEKVAKHFMSNFEYDSNEGLSVTGFIKTRDDDDSSSVTHEGTTDFKGTKVFSWSSDGDGFNFSGSLHNAEMLYKEIKDYLTMVLYI